MWAAKTKPLLPTIKSAVPRTQTLCLQSHRHPNPCNKPDNGHPLCPEHDNRAAGHVMPAEGPALAPQMDAHPIVLDAGATHVPPPGCALSNRERSTREDGAPPHLAPAFGPSSLPLASSHGLETFLTAMRVTSQETPQIDARTHTPRPGQRTATIRARSPLTLRHSHHARRTAISIANRASLSVGGTKLSLTDPRHQLCTVSESAR
jgi:hypothetical protein